MEKMVCSVCVRRYLSHVIGAFWRKDKYCKSTVVVPAVNKLIVVLIGADLSVTRGT